MSQLGRLLGGLGAFASGVVAFYGFLRLLQLRRFESYYQEVRRIVQVARGREGDPDAPPEPEARRAYLLDQLDDLKSEAIRDFAEGGLRGEGLLAGVAALVNDTRSSLAAEGPTPRRHPSPLHTELGDDLTEEGLPRSPSCMTPSGQRPAFDSRPASDEDAHHG